MKPFFTISWSRVVPGPHPPVQRRRLRRRHRPHAQETLQGFDQPILVVQHHPQPRHQSGPRVPLQGQGQPDLAEPDPEVSSQLPPHAGGELLLGGAPSDESFKPGRLLPSGAHVGLPERRQGGRTHALQVRTLIYSKLCYSHLQLSVINLKEKRHF